MTAAANENPRILIADDEQDILAQFSAILSPRANRDGKAQVIVDLEQKLFGDEVRRQELPELDVTLCRQGDDAVEEVRLAVATDRPYAAAFLDVRMPPGIDGVTTAAKIRALDPNICIVIVTGYSDVHPREIAKQAPPIDRLLYCQKPLQAAELEHLAHALAARWLTERELESVTDQLYQGQKLMAVGQLSGGVAHDFNNLLGVIMGNAELLAESLSDENPSINAILRAAVRGASLTQKLLAYSRQQMLENRRLDLNDLLGGMTNLFRYSLGETVEFETKCAEDLWPVFADWNQLENALLQLVLNARDAMPDGGRLTVETANAVLDGKGPAAGANVDAGDYVSLTVADTGRGIAPQILGHVFEPFFTTKEVGEGEGLGLSMVYGLVKQSGGCMDLRSEEGQGTAVTVYLPRAEAEIDRADPPHEPEARRARGETVLVLEDDPDLLRVEVVIVRRLGFQVLEARDSGDALSLLREHGEIDLLILDVVLPGSLSGPEVAKEAKKINSAIKVLFVSGYTDHPGVEHDEIDPKAHFIGKPFRKAALAHKIHLALQIP